MIFISHCDINCNDVIPSILFNDVIKMKEKIKRKDHQEELTINIGYKKKLIGLNKDN